MAEPLQFYLDAARALWDMPMARLEELRASGDPAALRRVAGDTLLVKAQFLTPDGLADERKALAILAASLQDDPEFSIDLALRVTGQNNPSRSRARAQAAVSARTRSHRWRPLLWTTLIAAAVLVALEVLAAAGVGVPHPISEVIERLTGGDTTRDATDDTGAIERSPSRAVETGQRAGFSDGPFSARPATSSRDPRARMSKGAPKAKNSRHANGKERNQANGQDRNQANGQERDKNVGQQKKKARKAKIVGVPERPSAATQVRRGLPRRSSGRPPAATRRAPRQGAKGTGRS